MELLKSSELDLGVELLLPMRPVQGSGLILSRLTIQSIIPNPSAWRMTFKVRLAITVAVLKFMTRLLVLTWWPKEQLTNK